MSLRDTILKADDIAEEIVDVPEWDDVKILLRAMDGNQQVAYADTVRGGSKFLYADILMVTAFDPDTSELIFDPADREALMAKSGGVLNRLGMRVLELSGSDVAAATEELDENPTSDGS